MRNSLATLWVGDRLGPIELASVASFLRMGNPLTVYSYAPIQNLPPAVQARDANEVLPTHRIAVYAREQSPSLHSNFFRFALMRNTDHTWVDLDMIALRPFDFPGDRIYGYEKPDQVNCAVLRLPKSSPTLADLSKLTAGTRGIAPHINGLRRAKYWVKTLGRGVPIDRWPWGSTGPRALTAYLRKHDELKHALPLEVLYPILTRDCRRFVVPGDLSDASFGEETKAVHLTASNINKIIKAEFGGEIPEDSFLGHHVAKARAAGLT
ncbi:hypothetical protein [Paracoccus laeviglucosivorans]|uniref:Alpha 1,4-glycosyltransferase conserved region n=1 Tax=Paracoccus laeviglucosivorans TaxID=1197861 RepID=A0A521DJA1_9RHOB|nr:hypothetical protein [Paracoccus laeviglucosivorans]SMO71823.1 hypothetical protein SAMN06265221_10884 [Paracoccus laeviglucosivorans]